MLNLCLCIDLILTLRNPFYPSKRRVKFYLIGSVIIVLLLVIFGNQSITGNLIKNLIILIYIVDCQDNDVKYNSVITKQTSNLVVAMSLSIYIIVALYSCVYAQRRLARPGLKNRERWFFLRKHYSYVGVFILIWTLNLASVYYQLFNPNDSQNEEVEDRLSIVQTISQFAAFSTGLWLTIVRLSEPYFYYMARTKWLEFFGIPPDNKSRKDDLFNDTLNSFLTQSLNVELVNIILQGITTFTRKSFDDHLQNNEVKVDDLDQFNLLRKLEIPRIEIDNPYREGKKSEKGQNLNINMTSDNTTAFEEPIRNKIIINETVEVFEHSGESSGKSGSFFFFSEDKNFIIKTMTDSELSTFKSMFQDYYEYLQNNPRSMLARIYGIFTVQMEDIVPVHLILMGNTIQCSKPSEILNKFDLKGSLFNRKVKGKNHERGTVLKDLNLFQQCQEHIFLRFSRDDRRALLDLMEDDIKFLSQHKLMDYSLLFCVEKNYNYYCLKMQAEQIVKTRLQDEQIIIEEDLKREIKIEKERLKGQLIQTFNGNRHMQISKCGKFIYHIAIIDYLQEFNFAKICESRFKEYILNRDYQEISCIDPIPYHKRFFKFMSNNVIIDFTEKKEDRQKHSFIVRRQLTFEND
eukprot:403342290